VSDDGGYHGRRGAVVRALVLSSVLLLACNDSKEYLVPGPVPQIVRVAGVDGDAGVPTASCTPADGGGACPLVVTVVFRLAEGSIVTKAIVRFEGDQNDTGVDHGYVVSPTVGKGAATDVSVTVDAAIPATILRAGALYTYSVRLLTAAGDESIATSLTVSVP